MGKCLLLFVSVLYSEGFVHVCSSFEELKVEIGTSSTLKRNLELIPFEKAHLRHGTILEPFNQNLNTLTLIYQLRGEVNYKYSNL